MSTVTRKTEIAPLNGTPEKRMFWSIISDYDLKTGLTELVDNAVDIWIGTKNRKPLLIDLSLDADRQIITLTDNAGGVLRDNLRLLIAPGGSTNSPNGESIGIFGVGSKRAVVAIAEHVSIRTHHAEDESYQIDITKEWLESPDWELPAYAIPEIDSGTTCITRLVFIGYSLPHADFEFRQLLSRMVRKDAKIDVILYHDGKADGKRRYKEECQRYRQFFGARKVTTNHKGVVTFVSKLPPPSTP